MAIAKRYRYVIYAVMSAILVVITAYMYYLNDPSFSPLAPKCFVRQLTGYDCPSCGVQRAIHSLLHLDVERAFWLNPFIFVVAPYIVLLILTSICRGKRWSIVRQWIHNRYMTYLYIVLFFLWWIIRNTSWYHSISPN